MTITPARLLNDQRGIFGLWTADFVGAITLFVILSTALDGTRLAILSLPVPILTLVLLVPIRLSTRRKIVRDSIFFWCTPRTLFEVKKHAFSTRT